MKATYWLRLTLGRLRGVLRRARVEREMEEELRFHVRMRAAENVRLGMTPEEAERAALRSFGNWARVKEACWDVKGGGVIETLRQDLKFGSRTLRRSPGFTAVAVMTLALGIGANTAIFSVVNAVLLRPLPYPAADRLMTARSNMSQLDLDDVLAQAQSFESAGSMTTHALDYTAGSEPLQVQAAFVTNELFDVLGAKPFAGRALTSRDNVKGGAQVAVLSHGFWQRELGGVDISHLTVTLSGQTYTVVGVLPASFISPRGTPDVWIPLRVGDPGAADQRGVHFLRPFFRLKPGVTPEQAQAEMNVVAEREAQLYPEENKGRQIRLLSLHEYKVGDVRPALLILFGAVGLVLLIACANFANLLLARAATRRQEVAVRTALGAGRLRIVRQMLTESVLLSVAGGAGGLLLALWGVEALRRMGPESLPRLQDVGVDWRVLAFTLGVSVLTGVVFGLAPALRASRVSLHDALKEGGRGEAGGASGGRLRSALVVSELALALVLLIGAGLLIKSFWRLRSDAPGFDPEHILTMRVELPEARYKEIPRQTRYRRELLERLNSLPGVEAAMVSELPLSGEELTHNMAFEGRPVEPGDEPEVPVRSVAGDYFRLMKIPLLRGRDLTPQDNENAPTAGVVNESFVRQYFPDSNPIGARVRWARDQPPQWMTIVGVVGDVKQMGLGQPEEPAFYYSYMQLDGKFKRWMYLTIRGRGDSAALARQVKEQVWAVDNMLPVTKVMPLTDVAAASIASQRFNMILLAVFASVALSLAAVGIYGLISYSVERRTREIGVRMALGAQRRDILALVVRQGVALALVGLALGLAGACAATRLLASLVYGVSTTDLATYAALSAFLLLVALVACLVPARRATKVDPMMALRYE